MNYIKKVRIVTVSDAADFVAIVSSIPESVRIKLFADKDTSINGRSFLGVMYIRQFPEIWCASDLDISDRIKKFVIED